MKYRPEIDGLRALAVIPVIFFHAGFELFSGGFIGVDVFFVISGYLITTIIVDDIEKNRFSIANFYERRSRRILPALLLVMLVCIPFAWMWMMPSQMKDFSESLVAVSLFASNILFAFETGYFSQTSEEKPLLHTWSLAVEEQYYLLFPIFLVMAWRFGKNNVFWIIVVLAAISLTLSELGWRSMSAANFYLAPTRAWELFAGSISAFVVQKRGLQTSNTLSLLGLAGIVFAIFIYDKSTPFPSVYTLIPVIGTMLLILFASTETVVAKLLRMNLFVGIGLISYSTYLWHQPLFAFARIKSMEEPSWILMSALSMLSTLLAFLSWRYVERPIRKKSFHVGAFGLSLIAVSITIFLVCFGYVGHRTDGFENQAISIYEGDVSHDLFFDFMKDEFVDCQDDRIRTNSLRHDNQIRCKQSRKGKLDVALIGDSHAEHLFPGIAKALPEKNVGYFIQADYPSLSSSYYHDVLTRIILGENIKIVLISIAHKRINPQSLNEIRSYIENLGDRRVVLIRDNPTFPKDPGYLKYGKFHSESGIFDLSNGDAAIQLEKLDAAYESLAEETGVELIHPYEALESDGILKMYNGDILLFRDQHHLNIDGSLFFGRKVAGKIQF